MGFLLRFIFFLFAAVALIAWMLLAYGRAEDPNLIPHAVPVGESVLQWGIRVSTSMIYFMLMDVAEAVPGLLTRWHRLQPIYRLGSLLFFAMGAVIAKDKLKHRRRIARLILSCDRGHKAFPIPGSYNRYRCYKGHQFAGDPHQVD